jgi:hypothetical protein
MGRQEPLVAPAVAEAGDAVAIELDGGLAQRCCTQVECAPVQGFGVLDIQVEQARLGLPERGTSAIIRVESPMRSSACPMRPSGPSMRSTCVASNTWDRNVIASAAPSTTRYGVIV